MDGRTDQDFGKRTCTHTGKESGDCLKARTFTVKREYLEGIKEVKHQSNLLGETLSGESDEFL